MRRVAIVGGGSAGLMAAERLAAVDGPELAIFGDMPTPGRKFLIPSHYIGCTQGRRLA